jgi:hypothetical protein
MSQMSRRGQTHSREGEKKRKRTIKKKASSSAKNRKGKKCNSSP